MGYEVATLKNKGNSYSVFEVGGVSIKFYTSPYLIRYCDIERWDNRGYIEYIGEFSTSPSPVEDSIDLSFIAGRLRLPKDLFRSIKEVRIV